MGGINFDHPAAVKPHIGILDADQGELALPADRTKLAICGFASSSREFAPYDDPAWVIVGLNQLYRHIPRADIWCDIHVNWNEHVVEGTDFHTWLREAPIPTLMAERVPSIPNSVRYPLERIIKKFGADYFTSTISFLIAWALFAGYKTIGIWGVDLIVGTEYFHQKACAEFWLGMANGMGVEIVLPQQTALCKQAYRYGYEFEPKFWPIKKSDLEKRLAAMDSERQKLLAQLHTIQGAIAEADRWREFMELTERGGQISPV